MGVDGSFGVSMPERAVYSPGLEAVVSKGKGDGRAWGESEPRRELRRIPPRGTESIGANDGLGGLRREIEWDWDGDPPSELIDMVTGQSDT